MATKTQKIDISSLGLFGRNEEVAALRSCFKGVTTSLNTKPERIAMDSSFAISHMFRTDTHQELLGLGGLCRLFSIVLL